MITSCGFSEAGSRFLHAELAGHSHDIRAMAFNRNATVLATASRGWLNWDQRGEVLLWEAPFPDKE